MTKYQSIFSFWEDCVWYHRRKDLFPITCHSLFKCPCVVIEPIVVSLGLHMRFSHLCYKACRWDNSNINFNINSTCALLGHFQLYAFWSLRSRFGQLRIPNEYKFGKDLYFFKHLFMTEDIDRAQTPTNPSKDHTMHTGYNLRLPRFEHMPNREQTCADSHSARLDGLAKTVSCHQ